MFNWLIKWFRKWFVKPPICRYCKYKQDAERRKTWYCTYKKITHICGETRPSTAPSWCPLK